MISPDRATGQADRASPATAAARPPRLAFLTIPGLGHFSPDLLRALPCPGVLDLRHIEVRGQQDLAAALAWADNPARDALWFEFCWPPFPALIAETDFTGRRILMRVHRIEAYGSAHAATAPWHKVDEAIVVGEDMARRLRQAAPAIAVRTRLHVVHNGLDLDRFRPAAAPPDPWRIGWCGWFTLHKNPNLALEVLHRLHAAGDTRWTLHMATRGGEAVAMDSFAHLLRRMGLERAVTVTEGIPQARMADWHARNAVLLSTSVYESFGYAIAEAAAVGCDLAVLDNPGAGEFWPEAVRFATVDQAVALIRAARPHRWRSLVEDRFSLAAQAETLRALILAPREGAGAAVPLRHGAWQGRIRLQDRAEPRQRRIAATGGFDEAALLEDLRLHLAPGALFLDLGAGIGDHALFAAGVCGARVIAWEPDAARAALCRENAALNGLGGRIALREGGATDLDGLVAEEGAAPAAIRIAGDAMAPLRGGAATLRRHRPALYLEAATPDAFLDLQDLLDPLGYLAVARFDPSPVWLFLPEERLATEQPAAAAA